MFFSNIDTVSVPELRSLTVFLKNDDILYPHLIGDYALFKATYAKHHQIVPDTIEWKSIAENLEILNDSDLRKILEPVMEDLSEVMKEKKGLQVLKTVNKDSTNERDPQSFNDSTADSTMNPEEISIEAIDLSPREVTGNGSSPASESSNTGESVFFSVPSESLGSQDSVQHYTPDSRKASPQTTCDSSTEWKSPTEDAKNLNDSDLQKKLEPVMDHLHEAMRETTSRPVLEANNKDNAHENDPKSSEGGEAVRYSPPQKIIETHSSSASSGNGASAFISVPTKSSGSREPFLYLTPKSKNPSSQTTYDSPSPNQRSRDSVQHHTTNDGTPPLNPNTTLEVTSSFWLLAIQSCFAISGVCAVIALVTCPPVAASLGLTTIFGVAVSDITVTAMYATGTAALFATGLFATTCDSPTPNQGSGDSVQQTPCSDGSADYDQIFDNSDNFDTTVCYEQCFGSTTPIIVGHNPILGKKTPSEPTSSFWLLAIQSCFAIGGVCAVIALVTCPPVAASLGLTTILSVAVSDITVTAMYATGAAALFVTGLFAVMPTSNQSDDKNRRPQP